MHFHGRDLLCTGDGGLIRYRDRDADDRADGPPDVLLKAKAGGEHDIHSIQRGPDGWWYLIAGNYSGVDESFVTLPTSPIPEPEAGVLLRLRPNLDGAEVVADGFRNAYDFAFDANGDAYVYDSDGERDVSLPWYRPTRVFMAVPGSHAGWVSRSWKRPGHFPDMPPVVGSFGRGSPTGVVCYRHDRFPEKYRGAIFALDWTFGRILCLPLEPDGAVVKSKPFEFATGEGLFGFAPTDAAVAPDGSLYVSVGGRGTRGGVYRIRWTGMLPERDAEGGTPIRSTSPSIPRNPSRVGRVRSGNRPPGSWEQTALRAAIVDESRAEAERVRAIEILTDQFGGVPPDSLAEILERAPESVRARAVWSVGRRMQGQPPSALTRRARRRITGRPPVDSGSTADGPTSQSTNSGERGRPECSRRSATRLRRPPTPHRGRPGRLPLSEGPLVPRDDPLARPAKPRP